MPRTAPETDKPWWQRRMPSFLVFLAVVLVVGVATIAVGVQVADVLPEVGKDQLGQDVWTDPVGLESAGGLEVAHIPDCAAGAVTRIALWDANSNPYWEVAGPATPLNSFFVGAAPGGFTVITPYKQPPPGTVLRLVVFRKLGGVAGIRFKESQLRKGRVVSGNPLARYTIAGYQDAKVCGGTGLTKTTFVAPGGSIPTTGG